jgi:Zn-dependent M28 family amino/carboxypeptidase
MMKKIFLGFALVISVVACAQQSKPLVNVKEVERIENFLASDDLRGRKAGTPEIDKAAAFIADEFKKSGLQPFQGNSFLQEFVMLRPKLGTLKYEAEGSEADTKNVVVITTEKDFKVNEKSGYQVVRIKQGDNLFEKANEYAHAAQNTLVYVDTSFAKNFSRLTFFKRQIAANSKNVVFVLGDPHTKEFTIKAEHSFAETKYANVVGLLPGKSRKNEYVIFSAHYDHIGVGKPVGNDSIFNGANDDAAGTTAVILLADYFKKMKNNERSILFVAFTAEEIGGYGSKYFSGQLDPNTVMAMFNIEMIGTESKWGKNSAFITGFEKSSMGAILQRNLKGTAFTFHPDPYPDQNLFYRSDNATLAELGVPAHTISTSKMDVEPNYHKVSDEVSTLDLENMTQIISAIAQSSTSIIAGKDTPTRVEKKKAF